MAGHVLPSGAGQGRGLPRIVEKDGELQKGLIPKAIGYAQGKEGVGENIALRMVLLRLGHPSQGGHLRKDMVKEPKLRQKGDPLGRTGSTEEADELIPNAFPRNLPDLLGMAADGLRGLLL